MYSEISEAFYMQHYQEAISPYLSGTKKREIADRISDLTLQAPIWLDRDSDWIDKFPELQGYVKVRLSGPYLCSIFKAIMNEFQEGREVTSDGLVQEEKA